MQEHSPDENIEKTIKAIVEALKENGRVLNDRKLKMIVQKKKKNSKDIIKALKILRKYKNIEIYYIENKKEVLIKLLLDEDEEPKLR